MARVQVASQAGKQFSLPHSTYDGEPVTSAAVQFDQNGWAFVEEGVWEEDYNGEPQRTLVRREPSAAEAHALQELYHLHGVVVFGDEAVEEEDHEDDE